MVKSQFFLKGEYTGKLELELEFPNFPVGASN